MNVSEATERTVFVLNGPNLNLLGSREPAVYGAATLSDVEGLCRAVAAEFGAGVVCRQSNHEGELIGWLHEAGAAAAVGVVLNPGGFTHTSVALRDAISAVDVPVVEVHISNVLRREPFRHVSLTGGAAVGSVMGLGVDGYGLAVRFLLGGVAGN